MRRSAVDRPLQFVLIVPDGAADLSREVGRSPLARAVSPYMDFIAREGITGLVQTLYADLPKESLVAQMGMLGWDPHRFYPGGRSSCELLARHGAMADGDLVFRANLVTLDGGVLQSYSAFNIEDGEATQLIDRVQGVLRGEFPEFHLYHNSDFRASLVVHNARVSARDLECREPHECEGQAFASTTLVMSRSPATQPVADRINRYLSRAADVLSHERANALLPWSASGPIRLPSFADINAFRGRAAVVGAMDFLCGLASAGGMDFYRVGNGRPTTDYRAKGEMTTELLGSGYAFVCCHINAPDEASHSHDRDLKIATIEHIDREVVRPVVAYFRAHPERLGGVMVAPDHYANCHLDGPGRRRIAAHSMEPVPFALWNGRDCDDAVVFSEDGVGCGRYARPPVTHLDLLNLLGVAV